jgi:hypothetical protein
MELRANLNLNQAAPPAHALDNCEDSLSQQWAGEAVGPGAGARLRGGKRRGERGGGVDGGGRVGVQEGLEFGVDEEGGHVWGWIVRILRQVEWG